MSDLKCPNGHVIPEEIIDSILHQFAIEEIDWTFITVPYLTGDQLNDSAMKNLVLRHVIESLTAQLAEAEKEDV